LYFEQSTHTERAEREKVKVETDMKLTILFAIVLMVAVVAAGEYTKFSHLTPREREKYN
jgi:hypothetical protein